jgi:hypothetical protein
MAQSSIHGFGELLATETGPDGRHSLVTQSAGTQNVITKFREAFQALDTTDTWELSKAAGDIVTIDGNTAGASYLVISLDPLTAGSKTTLKTRATYGSPFDISIGAHISQRTLGQEMSIDIVSDQPRDQDEPELAIASIQQTTTTLTVQTTTPHDLKVGSRIGVYGVPDSRMNYPALVVATVVSKTVFTSTAGPAGTIPSVTAGPFSAGFVYSRPALDRYPNGTSIIFENVTATQASFYSKSGSADLAPIAGTLANSHSTTIGTTASIAAATSPYNYAFRPTNEYRASFFVDGAQWSDSLVADNTLSQSTNRARSIQVVPDPSAQYKLQFRAISQKGLTVPVAQIVSATKTGSTTVTVVTDVPHGLTTADYVVAYGARDFTTNFPALAAATAVASVIDANTFTVVWGPSATAVTYGGYVAKVQGGNLMSSLGALATAIQSATLTAGALTVIGSATWTFLVGEYINVVGCRANLTGATLGVDGAYRVSMVSTTTMELEPVGATVVPADFTSTDCGGAAIRRTDLRVSFARILDFVRLRVENLPRPASDMSAAAPVAIQGGTLPAVTTVSTVTAVTTSGTPLAPATPYFVNSAATTNGALILTGTSGLQGFWATNFGATPAFVKLYNKATAPTVGTDVPEMTIPIPASAGGIPGIAPPIPLGHNGLRFPLGLGIAITGAAAANDTTAVAAGQVHVKLSRTV